MREANLFTMLSAYRPGAAATPFEAYCTAAVAYFLREGKHMLRSALARLGGAGAEELALVELHPQIGENGFADLMLTYEGGRRILVEIAVDTTVDEARMAMLAAAGTQWDAQPGRILLSPRHLTTIPGWEALSWLQVAEALEDDIDPLARQFAEFVLRDILGLGAVPLDDALTTNRLYALGAAAVRRRFGEGTRVVNSASRPLGGRYRYLGTTFASPDGALDYWVGIVNEALPLSDHYHLMLASKTTPLERPAQHPRATGDWKDWTHWTGTGRVVRPITPDGYDELLARIRA